MTKEEALAMDLALEALATEEYRLRQTGQSQVYPGIGFAITAIKQARSAPVQSCYCPNCEAMGKELAALKAQPVQEPVGEIGWGGSVNWHKAIPEFGTDLYTAAQPAPVQGPEYKFCDDGKVILKNPEMLSQRYRDATPPAAQRQWTGLTDEEIYDCDEANACRSALAYAIEAKLKEKNT
jgi:hypothetical protein